MITFLKICLLCYCVIFVVKLIEAIVGSALIGICLAFIIFGVLAAMTCGK